MNHSEKEELRKYFVVFDKGIKETGGDDEVVGAQPVVNDLIRKRYFIHPYLVFKSFVDGLIDTQSWGANHDCDSIWKMSSLVKAGIIKAYPAIVKLSIDEVRTTLSKLTLDDDLQDLADVAGVDLGLVVDNAILRLKQDLNLIEEKVENFIQDEEVMEQSSESKAS